MKKVFFRLIGLFSILFFTQFASAIDVWTCDANGRNCSMQPSTAGQSNSRSFSVSKDKCTIRPAGKIGCYKTLSNGCDWSLDHCKSKGVCDRNGGEWDPSSGSCVSKGSIAQEQPSSSGPSKEHNPYSGSEDSPCDPSVGTRGCDSGLKCIPMGGRDTSYVCKKDNTPPAQQSSEEEWKMKAIGCNLKNPGDKACCIQARGQWVDSEDGESYECKLGDSQEAQKVATELEKLRQQGLMCSQAAKKAAEECDQETNAQAQRSKQESTAALATLRQMGQASGSSSMFIKAANLTAGVELALGAMRLSCESEGEECTKQCDEAKTGAEMIRSRLITEQERREGQAIITEIERGYKKCGEYKGALNALLNDINKNALARMQALIAGNCSSNSMPADLQYCCQQPIPATCYNDPRISDPNNTAAWTPGSTPTIVPPTSPVCLTTPSAFGCQVAAKATDVRNNGGGASDFGRTGGGTSGGSTGSMPNFDFGSDGSHTSNGGSGKPTDLAPPQAGGGGFPGGGGGGLGPGGGGLGPGGGGGEHGGGSGDTLFDGTRVVGGGDPNRYGAGGAYQGGANSLALSGGKTGTGVSGKVGPDGKLLGQPDFSQFDRNKSKLGIRGIAGATGPDGITGPDTNIWKKINNGYVNDIIYSSDNKNK